jgi:recombination protein RecT
MRLSGSAYQKPGTPKSNFETEDNMAEKKQMVTVSGTSNDSATAEVLERIQEIVGTGGLALPPGYSPENAMKSAYLTLAGTIDRQKNPVLQSCTKASIINSLLDMVIQGLTPAKSQCYFVAYGKELTLLRSYMGTVAVAKRMGGVKDVFARCVYEGDEFSYDIEPETGTAHITKHSQSLGNIDNQKIVGAYAVVIRQGDPNYVEIMTMNEIRDAWGQGEMKGGSPAHKNFTQEMAKKSVVNRACKMFINTSDDTDILVGTFNKTTANELLESQIMLPSPQTMDENASKAADIIFGTTPVIDAPDAAVPGETPPEEETPAEAPDALKEAGK